MSANTSTGTPISRTASSLAISVSIVFELTLPGSDRIDASTALPPSSSPASSAAGATSATSLATTSVDNRDITRSNSTSSPRLNPAATIRSIRPVVGGSSLRRRSSASKCSRTRSPLRSTWVTSSTSHHVNASASGHTAFAEPERLTDLGTVVLDPSDQTSRRTRFRCDPHRSGGPRRRSPRLGSRSGRVETGPARCKSGAESRTPAV
ncbi:Uncharacterised protein [Mycobacteroides abscessus subsp. abscessus]|nr:Uncharacterised protein [Mycobacteroides abscessus subsp. abscessus]